MCSSCSSQSTSPATLVRTRNTHEQQRHHAAERSMTAPASPPSTSSVLHFRCQSSRNFMRARLMHTQHGLEYAGQLVRGGSAMDAGVSTCSYLCSSNGVRIRSCLDYVRRTSWSSISTECFTRNRNEEEEVSTSTPSTCEALRRDAAQSDHMNPTLLNCSLHEQDRTMTSRRIAYKFDRIHT